MRIVDKCGCLILVVVGVQAVITGQKNCNQVRRKEYGTGRKLNTGQYMCVTGLHDNSTKTETCQRFRDSLYGPLMFDAPRHAWTAGWQGYTAQHVWLDSHVRYLSVAGLTLTDDGSVAALAATWVRSACYSM